MSDRDKVRELAEEIAEDLYATRRESPEGLSESDPEAEIGVDRERWEARLRAFLVEREEEQRRALRAAAGDVVEIFLDARPPGTVDLVYTKLVRRLGLEDSDGS